MFEKLWMGFFNILVEGFCHEHRSGMRMEVDERESPVSQFTTDGPILCSDACFRTFSIDPVKGLQIAAEREKPKITEERGGDFAPHQEAGESTRKKSQPPKCH